MTHRDVSAPKQHREAIVFGVAGQDYCFDIMSVREIRGWTDTTALPYAQDYMKGVINLRGAVVPVIDLSARLGLGSTDPTHRHVIIIAVVSGKTVGLLADVVSDILKISPDMEHPVPGVVSEEVLSCISGVKAFPGIIESHMAEFAFEAQPRGSERSLNRTRKCSILVEDRMIRDLDLNHVVSTQVVEAA